MPAENESPHAAPWTVVVLTEEAFGDVDARNVAQLHAAERAEGQDVRHLVLVPADTQRSLLADVVDKLSLGELKEALADLRAGRPDAQEARADAETALRATVEALRAEGLTAQGRTTEDDPLPAVRTALAEEPDARELVVVTRPHAVEDTFHADWASRARDSLGVPVLHVYAGTTRLG
ncbi:hypothetical protein AB1207_23645 [Kineococcus endophyticus]|uniref:Universal stress protein family protein n=1 Tax=Kineococcus endophyticus TaxID=1181883 RepID=A0ABV3PDN3_9ACTN